MENGGENMDDNKVRPSKVCPICGGKTIVYDTLTNYKQEIERHRKCLYCGTRFKTIEKYLRIISNS